MTTRTLLIDIEGEQLSSEERELLAHPAVAGVVLFTRNYHEKAQLRALTDSIKAINHRFIIAADQEGGRVQRFKVGFSELPAMREWGYIYKENSNLAITQLQRQTETMVSELHEVGINVCLAPVLDIDFGVSQIIGERSFSDDPNIVIALARIVIEQMHAKGMPTTGKHFPGHGAVALDSHEALPKDERVYAALSEQDIAPYVALMDELDAVMPAHIIYSQVDKQHTVGCSRKWLQEILRKQLGFKGVIISDCLSMAAARAMADDPVERAERFLDAGCDLLTMCNDKQSAVAMMQHLERYVNDSAGHRIDRFVECFFAKELL